MPATFLHMADYHLGKRQYNSWRRQKDFTRAALARQIVDVQGFQQLVIISRDISFERATEKLIRVERRDGASEIQYG